MDLAVRTVGLPALTLWEEILQRKMAIQFMEDNNAAIRMIETGRFPLMRHLGHTHKVNLAST
jgi:hypothetical protein